MKALDKSKKMEYLSTAGLVLVAIIWGWGFVFSRMALEAGLGPSAVMFGRFTLAALVMGLVFRKQIRAHYRPGQWKSGLVIGSLLFIAFYVQILGLQRSTPANNAFITATYVVMVPFLWWLVSKKRPAPIIFIASLLSLAGVAILSVNVSGGLAVGLGDLITLLSAFLFAWHIVATGLLARSIHYMVLVFMQMLVAAVLSFGAFLITDRNFAGFLNWQGGLSVLFLGVFSTCVCYFIQTFAQRHLSSSKVGVLMATESLFGALFSVIMGYDQFTWRMAAGGAVMFASILLPELRFTGKAKPAPPDEAPPDTQD